MRIVIAAATAATGSMPATRHWRRLLLLLLLLRRRQRSGSSSSGGDKRFVARGRGCCAVLEAEEEFPELGLQPEEAQLRRRVVQKVRLYV